MKANLADMGSLAGESDGPLPPLVMSNLMFEQQKEMLLLQLKHEKRKQRTKIEKQIAIEKMHCEMEQAKLSLRRGKMVAMTDVSFDVGMSPPLESPDCFDVLGNLSLLPRFNRKEREAFSSLSSGSPRQGGGPNRPAR